jgi:hypothetical protein
MDSTKKPLGVTTMVYQDYFFLERWHRYYSAQVGAENLYVFSHGNDPRHAEIAVGSNVINLPRDKTMFKFDRRRWRMLGRFASGYLEFYNWMIVADVDEILVVDPAAAPSLIDYIETQYGGGDAPRNLSALCLELVHMPEHEPLPIEEDATILSRRRIFRPNRNYSKPCLVGGAVEFGPGGHRNNLGLRHMPDDLYLLHLKFFDRDRMQMVADARKQMVAEATGSNYEQDHSWSKTLQAYQDIIDTTSLAGEDIALPEFRAAMAKQVLKYTDQYLWGPARTDKLYRIPDRFSDVF